MSVEEAYSKWVDELTRYAALLVGTDAAGDVVADSFVGLMQGGRRSSWDDVRDPRSYLFRVVLNTARMHTRARARRSRRETKWMTSPSIEVAADPAVVRAVAALSVRQRAVVFLAYWEDLDADAIAELLHMSAGTVKRHLARARANLRKVL